MKRLEGKKELSILNYFVEKLRSGLITFINMVTLANRDYPYHDFETATTTAAHQHYIVGENNKALSGDQHKFFVSKSTLIMCTQNAYLRFNNARNVVITIAANTWYEFKSNIKSITYAWVTEAGTICIYCEGVLPEEQRSPL